MDDTYEPSEQLDAMMARTGAQMLETATAQGIEAAIALIDPGTGRIMVGTTPAVEGAPSVLLLREGADSVERALKHALVEALTEAAAATQARDDGDAPA